MQFTRLRLSGFKSFVDPTELVIEPGLSGVVGPNGCGKSNLVEALRWVMGETSAKKMRGGGMDDVIFGGSSDRPSRNVAEVVLVLDNTDRTAPAQFNDEEILEISRRIERESGSNYRINGREVRARDVQLLFADLATGARSGALVSQGRVGALINAKPSERRILLEEAAGISGLHSRRHEAELRLRAAEQNLERLDDVLAALDGQLKGLKRQARQASRYRNIGDQIRKTEAVLLHLRWHGATAELEEARGELDGIAAQVVEWTRLGAERSRVQGELSERLPPLRKAEAEAAAALHRLNVARDALDAEAERLRVAREEAGARLAQAEQDMAREQTLVADADAARTRLAEERDRLIEEDEGSEAALDDAAEDVTAAEVEVEQLDEKLAAVSQAVAAEEARVTAARRRIREIEERRDRLRQRLEGTTKERTELEARAARAAGIEEAATAVEAAAAALETLQGRSEEAETARTAAGEQESRVRDEVRQLDSRLAELRAEERALAALLADDAPNEHRRMIDAVEVRAGFEEALGAALGEDLTGADDPAASMHWRVLPPLNGAPPLPAGCTPLIEHVQGPPALARRLSQIGVVPDNGDGAALAEGLAVGQRLVSRHGDLWRWDGFVVRADAETPAARRLSQRNRLTEVRGALDAATRAAEEGQQRLKAAQTAAAEAAQREREIRSETRQAISALAAARDRHDRLVRESAADASRLSTLSELAERLAGDLAEAEAELEEARGAAEGAFDLEARRADQTRLREELGAARSRLVERRSRHDRLVRETEARAARLESIAQDILSWEERMNDARRQLQVLDDRRAAAREEIERLDRAPEEIAKRRGALMDEITGAEKRRREAADRLAAAETELGTAAKALREAENALADAREQRARAEGTVNQAEQARQAIVERMRERLDCGPEEALGVAGMGPDDTLPELGQVEARLDRLVRERDGMGPVNLRAEQEARELEEQIETLQTERGDLIAAIARLRQGIQELNREGRERLLASFAAVNEHFERLFTRLFGGGHAHIKLVESEDPLDAGLEIFASPPGKRLQALSLLSGGEQAMTALALLFSVFLTNPAPICVLDEVDAPLDDANVDRFCLLLGDIAKASNTRFMVVTHHRLTMARMDRLFGVTMPEQGVSQLVSVDLATAEKLRDSA